MNTHYKRDLGRKMKGAGKDGDSDSDPPRLFVRENPYLGGNSLYMEETDSVRIPELERSFPAPSLGDLDKLPAEIKSMVLLQLDVRSLCRFMSVSSGAKEAADSLLEYRNLVRHAGPVLVMLGKTRLTKTYTVDSLYQVLTSASCVSCGQPGAFICLVTCERACLNCLNRNMRFWVLTPAEARKAYVLRVQDVDTLPTLWTVQQPRRYPKVRRQKVVNERHAARLALARHGEDGDSGENGRCWKTVARDDELVDWTTKGWEFMTNDTRPVACKKWGLQFMRMPYLKGGTRLEPIVWCEGCAARYSNGNEEHIHHGLAYNNWRNMRAGLTVQGAKELEAKEKVSLREWTLTELLGHLEVCEGVPLLKCKANWGIPDYWLY